MMPKPNVIERMESLAQQWEAVDDQRAIFLRCYSMMTDNMLVAIEHGRFQDSEWVDQLLHRFADYYFDALACFDCGDPVPPVWQAVYEAAREDLHVLQHLLLGVNAHINYDLVLTLYDVLSPEWSSLDPAQRRQRYEDHRLVNIIIGETIDRVQDEVIEQYDPRMDWVDRLLGRLDERLLTGLITRWRESVWETAQALLESPTAEREQIQKELEERVLRINRQLLLRLF